MRRIAGFTISDGEVEVSVVGDVDSTTSKGVLVIEHPKLDIKPIAMSEVDVKLIGHYCQAWWPTLARQAIEIAKEKTAS